MRKSKYVNKGIYSVRMNIKDFNRHLNNNNFIKINNIIFNDDEVSFTLYDKNEYREFLNAGGKRAKHSKDLNWFVSLFKRNIGVFIGIIVFIAYLLIRSQSVTDVLINVETDKNDEIIAEIESHFNTIADINFLDDSISDINFELRKKYSYFEWISVRRVGTVLIVDIIESNIGVPKLENHEEVGDLVATETGMVKFFQATYGIPLVSFNQLVKEGDVLITGDLYFHRSEEEYLYIYPEGFVIAEVWEYKTITVPKTIQENIKTGKVHEEKIYSFFGISIKFNSFRDKYDSYTVEEKVDYLTLFEKKIPIFEKKIYYYENNDIIKMYTKNQAVTYAETIIEYEFAENKEYQEEFIKNIELIYANETNDGYEIKFLIVQNKNIAKFQRRLVDE